MGANVDATILQKARHVGGEGYIKIKVAKNVVLRKHFVGSAVEYAVSIVQYDHAIGLRGFFHEVSDHDNGHALFVELFAYAHQAAASARIKHGRSLIENQDGGMHCQHARNGDALFLASRKGCGFALAGAG